MSCAQGRIDPMDNNTGLRNSDFRKALVKNPIKNKKGKAAENKDEAAIPQPSNLVIAPPPPNYVSEKIISFSVTDQVPLKDVLIELGRVAKIDVDMDPDITGGIILTARNRPLGEILERIAALANIRYSYKNGVLHFDKDTPYTKNYQVDYLSEGSNLWSEVQSNISSILVNSAKADRPDPALNNATNNSSTTPNSASANSRAASISINKAAGILTIFASKKQHDEVVKYLANVEKNASLQVLIEAKVVEVTLTDEFNTGINWTSLGKQTTISSANSYTAGGPLSIVASELFNTDLSASISALETFGTVRALSSPRVHALNNQKATLNFTDKYVYFRIDNNQNTTVANNNSLNTQTLTSTKLEENVGVELNITPSINIKTNEISLAIKPKITVVSGTVVDPASPKGLTDENNKAVVNRVPIIQTREINTLAKVQSGNIMVIGGLMKESAQSTETGIPFLQRIPVLGYLFKKSSKKSELVETVIFIKATIVTSNSVVGKTDRDIQEKFDTNKRKFF